MNFSGDFRRYDIAVKNVETTYRWAIASDGHFDFSACYTHNYREFMGGFGDWAGEVAESRSFKDYRQKVSPSESASLWQSLSFGANYKAAYCMAACPAGENVIGPFLRNRVGFVQDVVKPLQDKDETIYVVPGSDAEAHVARRFPHKQVKQVRNTLVPPRTVEGFVRGMPLLFQRNQSEGLDAVWAILRRQIRLKGSWRSLLAFSKCFPG